jgi:pyruvate formate lyase activating enzyme
MGETGGLVRASESEALTRRRFLCMTAQVGLSCCAGGFLARGVLAADGTSGLKEALYYRGLPDAKTQCTLCPNLCVRGPGEDGQCRARGNRRGRYYSLVYGRPCVIALDSVAKCPLNHYELPSKVFSIATAGCNLTCSYCQNWTYSQAGPDQVPKQLELSPRAVVQKAQQNKASGIAYFYTEPVVYYEYMLDVAKLARARRLTNVMVTAGYISPEPFRAALPLMDAVTFGLKGWDDAFYQEYIGCPLEPVKEAIRVLAQAKNVWWEVVNLIIPSLNDDMADIAAMAQWLRQTAGAERPLHFTRFRPQYKLKRLPITPTATLTKARDTAMAQGLKYVYVGNMPGHQGANTICPNCGKVVVERMAFTVLKKNLKGGRCAFCGHQIGGLWL